MIDRRTQMARLMLDAPDPVVAISDLVADHEMRLDALVRRIVSIEAVLKDREQ